jgi:hypothetical protein
MLLFTFSILACDRSRVLECVSVVCMCVVIVKRKEKLCSYMYHVVLLVIIRDLLMRIYIIW